MKLVRNTIQLLFNSYRKSTDTTFKIKRSISFTASLQIPSITKKRDRLILKKDNVSVEVLYFWLRDHCICSTCYNRETNQRKLDLLTVNRNINPVKEETFDGKLKIVWSDGHESVYDINWLNQNLSSNRKMPKSIQKFHWNAEKINSVGIPSVTYKEFFEIYGLRKHLKNLLIYGINCITEAPPTYEATQEVCNRTSLVEETVYGKFWKFSNEQMDHADMAFTNLALPAHTDSTYYTHTAGFQVFQCLEHTGGSGGETLLVDGFHALQELKENNEDAFQFLCDTPIPHHFLDKTDHLFAELPIIQRNPLSGEFVQIRFNPNDRAPLTNLSDANKIQKFYDAYIALTKLVRKKENELWFKLQPGTILFIDNFRVLHGRAAFNGKRVLAGCYLTRDDLLSKARVLGLS